MDELSADDLLTLLRRHLRFLEASDEFTLDTELRDLGLNSMGAIDLLLDLESSFGITFPDELLAPETFRTAASIRDAIIKVRAERSPG